MLHEAPSLEVLGYGDLLENTPLLLAPVAVKAMTLPSSKARTVQGVPRCYVYGMLSWIRGDGQCETSITNVCLVCSGSNPGAPSCSSHAVLLDVISRSSGRRPKLGDAYKGHVQAVSYASYAKVLVFPLPHR